MPVSASWFHLYDDNKYAKIEGWLTLYHLVATHSVNFACFPGKAYLLHDIST